MRTHMTVQQQSQDSSSPQPLSSVMCVNSYIGKRPNPSYAPPSLNFVTPIPPSNLPSVLLTQEQDFTKVPVAAASGKVKYTPDNPGLTAKLHKRHFVQHNYHDYANEVDTAAAADTSTNDSSSQDPPAKKPPTRRGTVSTPFPEKLHQMLDKIEQDGHASVVSWQPHGRAFLVHKPKDFVATIMPKYFRQSKISSFQRQLNLYGFCRLTRGPDKGAYYHELFLRGKPFLSERMIRTRVKGTFIKASSSPESEPNFYAMPPVTVGGLNPAEDASLQDSADLPEPDEATSDACGDGGESSTTLAAEPDNKGKEEPPVLSATAALENANDLLLQQSCCATEQVSRNNAAHDSDLAKNFNAAQGFHDAAAAAAAVDDDDDDDDMSSQVDESSAGVVATSKKTTLTRRESTTSLVSITEAELKDRKAMDDFFKDFDVEPSRFELAEDDDACLGDVLDQLMEEY